MLSSVLQSRRAILVNIEIMRIFVRLRTLPVTKEELAVKLSSLERKYDAQFQVVFDVIQKLIQPESPAEAPHRLQGHRGVTAFELPCLEPLS
jgi:hypothetical protein